MDVDDFSRRYLAQETPLSDSKWQTAPIWTKLLSLATSGGTGNGVEGEVLASTTTAGGDNQDGGWSFPCSPGKSVTFGGGDGNGGDPVTYLRSDSRALEGLSRDNISALDTVSAAGASLPQDADNQGGGGSGPRSPGVFARLWAECIGDDTCSAFASIDGASTTGGSDGKASTRGGPETACPRQHPPAPPLSSPRNLGPWERLVAVLRGDRGIDVSQVLTTHEQILLEREVADWVHRAQGRKGREVGKGMAERLASAAAAALCQEETKPAAASARPRGTRAAGEPAAKASSAGIAAVEESCSGGIPNAGRRRLSVGGFEFPAVVVEGSALSPVGNSPETNTERAGSRGPSATVDDTSEGAGAETATSGAKGTPERQLDLRRVALDAHEVCPPICRVVREVLRTFPRPPPCLSCMPRGFALLKKIQVAWYEHRRVEGKRRRM